MNAGLAELLRELRRAAAAAGHVFVALDFDGTLAPIVDSPEAAAMPPQTLESLRGIAASDRYSLALVSGRSVSDLRARVGLDVTYAGNHGLEIEGPGVSFAHPGAKLLRGAVEHACLDLEAAFQTIPGIVVERKGVTATVHFRRAPVDLGDWIAGTVALVTRPYRRCVTVARARKAWEIRPAVPWNKGSAVRFLWNRFSPSPLLVCAGDDESDEQMFAAVSGAISIRVGKTVSTLATYQVGSLADLLDCLQVLRAAASPA